MNASGAIRDFIYLDVDRISSFVAQHAGGLPSERTKEIGHDASGKVSGEGSLFWFAKAAAEGQYGFSTASSEKSILHDALFSAFYETLEQNDCFFEKRCTSPGAWRKDVFADGAVLVVNGVLRIIDYPHQSEWMKEVPQIIDTINAVQTTFATLAERDALANGQNPPGPPDLIGNEYHEIPLSELSSLIDRFYGDAVRVKVFPFKDHNDKVLVGTGDRQKFRMAPHALRSAYGSVIDANWHTVLQVARGNDHKPAEYASKTGNQVEDSFEQMYDIIANVSNLGQSIRFPAVAMTPIAIYRDILS